ncbi:MAG TPA: HAMP domain-containing sensor histidine kinase [Tepidisphaeraceae bacterium]|nr:HAMP domain-containing sensor histidine kinase [Tepidisphaeraceae bacterium]
MKNRTMDLLKYQPFPALAGAVRASSGVVIQRWQTAVRETLPTANALTTQQLHNDLPNILGLIADALEADEPGATKALMDEAVTHGEVRYDQNFNIGDVLVEYSLLRRLLCESVLGHLDRELTVEELSALNLAVDVAVRRGVVSFASEQRNELQSVVEAQTKYLSFLSHDLRGGLNGVLLMIEVLRRDLAKEPKFGESLEDLDVMRRSILETVGTMDRFLHAERFRKGKVQVRPSRVDMKRVVNEVTTHFSYQAKDKNLRLVQEVNDGVTVVSDKELVIVILQNLVANAVKYTPSGDVRIKVEPDQTNGCLVSVIDQGPGIAQEKLTQLFTPFARGETHGQPGTGLGLSIARQAADLLKAKLWAESKPGQGSAFYLQLPRELPENPPPA